jgi:hypothetical protein
MRLKMGYFYIFSWIFCCSYNYSVNLPKCSRVVGIHTVSGISAAVCAATVDGNNDSYADYICDVYIVSTAA